jgi:hypothetical protein
MNKTVFDLQGIDLKKSISAETATKHYESKLAKYRHKTL